MSKPTIEELTEIAKQRAVQLQNCCGRCHHCIASRKIVEAYERYEHARLNDWPEEVADCDKCGGFTKVGKWGPDETCQMDICEPCWADKDGFAKWLWAEMEQVLAADPAYVEAEKGRWRYVGNEES
jgi:hypothetical protein